MQPNDFATYVAAFGGTISTVVLLVDKVLSMPVIDNFKQGSYDSFAKTIGFDIFGDSYPFKIEEISINNMDIMSYTPNVSIPSDRKFCRSIHPGRTVRRAHSRENFNFLVTAVDGYWPRESVLTVSTRFWIFKKTLRKTILW